MSANTIATVLRASDDVRAGAIDHLAGEIVRALEADHCILEPEQRADLRTVLDFLALCADEFPLPDAVREAGNRLLPLTGES